MDETYLGGVRLGRGGRGAAGKAIVAIAVECRGKGFGRVRMRRIPNCSQEELTDFALAAIEEGTVVYTDHWPGYDPLATCGYQHLPTNIAQTGDPAHVAMPRVHRVASLLKRWLLSTHQGGVRAHPLDYYLDELTFRFNRRSSNHVGLLFYRRPQQVVQADPAPQHNIIGGGR